MLLRRLEFSGIGPFAGHHSIDMDQLTAQNVFLIEGPTGAGKSSIIDAIVFALYGGVAGKESSDKRMRSSHADLNTESWVDLVFTVASGTYRVRRSPAQTIAKKRGKGTRELAQHASLWRLSESAVDAQEWDAGEPLASQARETSQIIRDIVGISKEQFVQTVVLPQGQFADFLRLTSKDRSALLEKIFHTDTYRDLMEDLKAQAKEAQAQIEQAYAAYSSAIDVWLNNPGLSDECKKSLEEYRAAALSEKIPESPSSSEASSDREFLAHVHTACETLDTASTQAEACCEAAQKAEQQAQTALNEGNHLATLLSKKAELLAHQAELEKRTPAIESLRHKIDQHNQASIPLLRHKDADQSQAALEAASQAAHEENPTSAGVQKKLHTCDRKINELGEQLGQLHALLEEEKNLHERKESHHHLLEKSSALTASISDIHEQIIHIPQRIEALREKQQTAHELAEKEPDHSRELESTQALIRIAKDHVQASIEEDKSSQALQQALSAQHDAQTTFDRLTAQWVASVAANLAQQLEENTPCPVCGSREHPAPAQPSESYTDRAHVQQAQKALEEAHTALSEAHNAYSSAHATYTSLSSQLGDHTLESLVAREEELTSSIAQAHISAQEAADAAKEIELLQRQHNDMHEDLAHKREAAASLTSTISESAAAIKEQEEKIAQAQGDFSSIKEKYEDLLSRRDAWQQQRELYAHLSTTLADYEQIAQTAEEALKDSPFTSIEEAQEAYISADTLSEYQEEISSYQDAFSGVKAQLAEPSIAQLSGKEHVDIEKLTEQFTHTKEARENAQKAATLSREYARSAHRALKKMITANKEWHKAADSAGAICRLASIATAGESSLTNIPLNIWVLLKRFEIVVDRANEHLNTISGGRYELKRVDESSGNKKAGLDLKVIDREGSDRGDEERETSSLSGGETFYTSLALALALAEVVQEEQGGIRIDTLIIDEGFGTLSEDVREAVMRTLTSLSAHGRVVGIVSHIEELKRMVPNRISVQRTPHGGSTLSVTA